MTFTDKEYTNFIDHNKQTLFNIKTYSPRPISDNVWVKTIRKPAASQKFCALISEKEGSNLDNESTEWTQTKSLWKYRSNTSVTLDMIDFHNLSGELQINTNYTYCKCCQRGTSPLILRGRDRRPHGKSFIAD